MNSKKVKVWCEWDMGFSNIDDNNSVFDSREEAIEILEQVNWKQIGCENWQEVESDGLLTIEEI